MKITVADAQTEPPVQIMVLEGELDASNYESLIAAGKELAASGVRNLLLDLSGVNFMSSSGLVALHSLALLLQGEKADDTEQGWGALHALERDIEKGPQNRLKILNPHPKVAQTLEVTGIDQYIRVYSDQQDALEAFAGSSG